MELEDDLHDFDGTCRLFPLPNFVLFPHAVLPLHIFEPRYRQMTEDALASDRLVTMVQIRPDADWKKTVDPPIETVACLGRILEYERLADGRFNFLLVGRKRVRLLEELPKTRLYRQARVQILEDVYESVAGDGTRRELTRLFRQCRERDRPADRELIRLLDSEIDLGPLTDIIGHSLGLPSAIKQTLLSEPSVEIRALGLIRILEQLLGTPASTTHERGFPPPFSMN